MNQIAPVQHASKAHYEDALDAVSGHGPEWLRVLRGEARARFLDAEFPHRKMEAWRFTNIAPILRTPFRSSLSPRGDGVSVDAVQPLRYNQSGWVELVFIDGFFSPDLSSLQPNVEAGGLAAAVWGREELARGHLGRYVNGTSNAFSLLNGALLLDGACIRVPEHVSLDAPIHLLFVSTGRESEVATFPRNLIVLEPHSEAQVVETYAALGEACYLSNVVTEIAVGNGARLQRFKIIHEAGAAYHLSSTQIRQGASSAVRSFVMVQGGAIVRDELASRLDGEGADCSFNGLYMTDGHQLVDNHTSIEHAKPNCTSWIGYKGVLQDKSHAVFSGRIHVHRGAQKTDSKQLNQNMLLSDKATVNTKPLLEIFADDVKCTHGATVGPPPHELIFYFQTRGMSPAMALAMLTYGFADEIVNQIDVDAVRQRLETFVYRKYSPIRA